MNDTDACWSRIGVSGDGSCPELARVVHCRNCEVYARAGRRMLDQAAPPGYLEYWATRLAAAEEAAAPDLLSTVVFRLADEHLALPTTAFVEAVDVRPIHRLPHRPAGALLGVVNIRGELQLCVSLAVLLSIEPAAAGTAPHGTPRLAVIESTGERWVFPVDELRGVHRVARPTLMPPPATLAHDARAVTAALFELGTDRVALLDADLVFARLRRIVP